MSTSRMTLVRHAQAHCSVRGIVGGLRGCNGLTDRGRHQARLLARRLAHEHAAEPIAAAYSAPSPRTHETAQIIASEVGIPITNDNDLREPDYGEADGRPWTDVVTAFGRIPALHPELPIAPGAEPWATYLDRAIRALHAIRDRHFQQTTLIIGHGESVTAAAHLFLGLPLESRATAAFAVHYAGITRWEQQPLVWTRPDAGQRWTLVRHNDTAHLDGQPQPPLPVQQPA